MGEGRFSFGFGPDSAKCFCSQGYGRLDPVVALQLCSLVQGCLLHHIVLMHTPQPAPKTWAPPCCGQLKLRSVCVCVCVSFSKIHVKFTIVNIFWCTAQWYYLHIVI